MYAQDIDGMRVWLREACDLGWLERYGKVFAVFDEQDSGNLCFGVEGAGKKLFVKYAGAQTIGYDGSTDDAVARLAASETIYRALRHPVLVELLDGCWVDGGVGYVLVFDWFSGENLRPHWLKTPAERYGSKGAPFTKLICLPYSTRLALFDSILRFHMLVESLGYVCIDFYDGSILYDFTSNEARICDIDLYARMPYVNEMGRLWGSSRFMAPEEFQMGASIDSRTNVYRMGATAFYLFGGISNNGEPNRTFQRWTARDAQYRAACRAVDPSPDNRHSHLEAFYIDWEAAREDYTQ